MKAARHASCSHLAGPASAQGGLNPAKLGAPPTDTWPMYNGDYSGRRFSTLTKINQSNINSLSLAWVYRANGAPAAAVPAAASRRRPCR